MSSYPLFISHGTTSVINNWAITIQFYTKNILHRVLF